MSLLQYQSNTDIPTVQFTMHPMVLAALKEASDEGRSPSLQMIPQNILESSQFLNQMTSQVNSWNKQIQAVTKLVKDSDCGSAAQEISFWISLEGNLARIDQQLQSPGVQLSLDVLTNAKRYQAGIGLKNDADLAGAQQTVHNYNVLMRDFPLDDLSSATTLGRVQDALAQIFNHINKKLRLSTNYPVKRALKLVEGVSEDLNTQLHRVLHGRPLLALTYDQFQEVTRATDAIWASWDESVREFTSVARDLIRKRNTEFVPIKIQPRPSSDSGPPQVYQHVPTWPRTASADYYPCPRSSIPLRFSFETYQLSIELLYLRRSAMLTRYKKLLMLTTRSEMLTCSIPHQVALSSGSKLSYNTPNAPRESRTRLLHVYEID